YTPANFDPCMLPAPVALDVTSTATLDVGSTVLPKKMLTQSDQQPLMVIHLSTLHIGAQLTINGVATVLAVDGDVTIDAAGSIVAVAGADNGFQCMTARGGTGGDSTNGTSGAGGGGGGGAEDLGGLASDGG